MPFESYLCYVEEKKGQLHCFCHGFKVKSFVIALDGIAEGKAFGELSDKKRCDLSAFWVVALEQNT